MRNAFFAFSFIIEGTTEKVLQFIMPLESIYSRNSGLIEQKMYFWTLQRVSSKENYWLTLFLPWKKYLLTFSELPPICSCLYYKSQVWLILNCCTNWNNHITTISMHRTITHVNCISKHKTSSSRWLYIFLCIKP